MIIINNFDRDTAFIETTEKRIAREILSMIERVCFSEEYRDFRVGWGSKGQRDLIIQMIQEKYGVV